jgi:hypothetical protein
VRCLSSSDVIAYAFPLTSEPPLYVPTCLRVCPVSSSWMVRRVALVTIDVFLRSVSRLLLTANVLHISPILATLMVVALSSSETSVLT